MRPDPGIRLWAGIPAPTFQVRQEWRDSALNPFVVRSRLAIDCREPASSGAAMKRTLLLLWALTAQITLPGVFAAENSTYLRIDAADAHDPAVLTLGVHHQIDYGHFLWLGVDSRQLTLLGDAGLLSRPAADFTLTLGDLRFDPLTADPRELQPEGWHSPDRKSQTPG